MKDEQGKERRKKMKFTREPKSGFAEAREKERSVLKLLYNEHLDLKTQDSFI
ncbi:hypothetical protein SLEP1_g56263 [Rubroshorea leprosula]|uniref:Uncharacterized protein n=1 Tax=Rubroshorea leprosula TaxID=152421 RepID=A0AAV5MK50_9ROSI|nr:hypothetical protein SLEP1_g56263 [Rubroshorea leprosula]